MESSYLDDRVGGRMQPSPFALNLIEELQPRQTYLTHISHRLGFHDEVEKALPVAVNLAYDGLKINV